ncbi:hypothetical protein [Mucilaginibacter psychrotolerans]|uniref:Uncharacterized protein n=1 Tax=Mucilaginibacter psychrotolerans TaxID=1524096 RepID=A0A4Y8S3G7_9SPHI|nr:hypothetical protein [Mucilaginibacter psychrotolerans]TFF33316.1 hypothetical protein E2R66_26625 [Mucilaginibacter psychrotolerans]
MKNKSFLIVSSLFILSCTKRADTEIAILTGSGQKLWRVESTFDSTRTKYDYYLLKKDGTCFNYLIFGDGKFHQYVSGEVIKENKWRLNLDTLTIMDGTYLIKKINNDSVILKHFGKFDINLVNSGLDLSSK